MGVEKKDSNTKYEIIQENDLSDFKEKENIDNVACTSYLVQDVSVNLGLYKKSTLHTSKYCGFCWLRDKCGKIIDSNGKKTVLKIGSKFDCINVNEMISTIMGDEEFGEYLSLDAEPGERMITYFLNEPLLEGDSMEEDNRYLTAVSFLHLLKNILRHSLMQKVMIVSNNYVGKIKGRIDIRKQIVTNTSHGREDKIYCKCRVKTVDIIENQILKYAFEKSKEYIETKALRTSSKCIEVIMSIINLCNRELADVSSKKITEEEIDKVHLPNMYSYYLPAINLAKIILMELSVCDANEKSKVSIVPYAINMPLLFECYARTEIKKMIETINSNEELSANYHLEMKKYVKNGQSVCGDDYGYKEVVSGNKCYISGIIIPDIVIKYINNVKSEDYYYRVYDVKYKDAENKIFNRDDRLQLLAYQYMYNCKDNIGHIFPKEFSNSIIKYCLFKQDKSKLYYVYCSKNNNQWLTP